MLDDLYKSQGKESKELKSGQCIMLSRTLKDKKNWSADLGNYINTTFDIRKDHKKFEYTVLDMVDNLTVYPKNTSDDLCLIIRMDEFYDIFTDKDTKEKYSLEQYVDSLNFYLDDVDSDLVTQIEDIISDSECIDLFNQHEYYREERASYYQSIIIYVLLFSFCSISIFINLELMNIYDIDIRKYEYAMQKAIGIDESFNKKVILLENLYVFILGLLVGSAMSAMTIYILYDYGIINSINLHSSIVIGIFVEFIIYAVLTYCFISRKISKISTIRDIYS